MGLTKKQIVDATEIIKMYTDDKIEDSELQIRTLIQSLYDVIVNNSDNVIDVVDKSHGLQDTPVGTILSYMGIIAPPHYLICDGTIYNITDYPILANHIKHHFGSYNKWGGDGIDTFAVPDLRGEFLRGAGKTGANVGVHQDATKHPNVWSYVNSSTGNAITVSQYVDANTMTNYVNADSTVPATYYHDGHSDKVKPRTGNAALYTARPTNTSILYIIKYEPTYYINVEHSGGKS